VRNILGESRTNWREVMTKVKRGDVFFADLDPVLGSEQGGVRPVLVVQNDVGNQHSPTTIVAAITGQMCKAKLPTHVDLAGRENGLSKNSVVLVEQVRTIDKQRLKERICSLDRLLMEQVDQALQISLGLRSPFLREEDGIQNGANRTEQTNTTTKVVETVVK